MGNHSRRSALHVRLALVILAVSLLIGGVL